MPIDVQTAATIALEYGLQLPDVRALIMLADDEPEARKLAARFSPNGRRQPHSQSSWPVLVGFGSNGVGHSAGNVVKRMICS